MGWALSLRPNTAVVLAALRRGLVVDPDRGLFGGVPQVLRPDNGLEFVNAALERVCAVLGITLAPAPAYMLNRKGKVERANLTVDQEFLCRLPFYTEGPRAGGWAAVRPGRPADGAGVVRGPLRRVGHRLQHRAGCTRRWAGRPRCRSRLEPERVDSRRATARAPNLRRYQACSAANCHGGASSRNRMQLAPVRLS
jgi:hypothetical protein